MKKESLIEPPESRMLKSCKVTLLPGESVGRHTTDKREEIIIVIRGKATVSEGEKKTELKAGEARYIKEGVKHNVQNNSDEELEYVYVATLFD